MNYILIIIYMQLNVYLISHPIIQKLSNTIINSKPENNQIYNYNTSSLGFLLIYEVIRKWIKTQNIYIKNIELTKELYVFNSKESYLIIANLMDCNQIISGISLLLPQVHLQHINLNTYKKKYINNDCIDSNIINIIKKQKIIIIERFLSNYSIIKLLDYLLLKQHIKISQIKIMCITCTNSICEQLGNKYQSLEIYTTKIYNY
uniref:hypothetical protein n=1 Tax=Anunuuluaehu liula TaxID=3049639 RepID=UPI003001F160